MDLILAFSLQDQVEKYGAYVGLAAFLGLAVLSLLYFAQARELKRLRDWAGRAPERALEMEARVVAQAEEALREPEPAAERSGTVGPAVPAAASGNGRPQGVPAPIPMGPRPATAMAALAAQAATAQATVEAPAVVEDETVAPGGDGTAVAAGDDGAVAPGGDDARAAVAPAGADAAAPPAGDHAAADGDAAAPPDGDQAAAPPADEDRPEDAPAGDDRAPEPAQSGNGVPSGPPAEIPRATPRPQPKPLPRPAPEAAPLRAAAPSRAAALPPRRTVPSRPSRGGGGSRAGLYTLIGIVVLAAAIFVPVYFMVLSGDDPAPPPNPVADPGASPAGAGTRAAEARPEKVVVVLNGTPIPGLASRYRDELVAAGYSDEQGMIRIDNNDDQQRQDSIVYYDPEERRQARDVARLLDITRTEEIDEETQALADSSDESGTLPADVTVILGADKSP
jgi:hypothetical protein